MDPQFLIEDTRHLEDFKDKSYSGFKKTDVIKTLFKSIESGKVENACHWITECMVSGYCIDILDKLMAHSSKVIHINNPKLPAYLWRKYQSFFKTINNINLKKQKHLCIHFRNNQVLRNLYFDIVSVITLSPKSKRFDKYPKINEGTDFLFENITKRLHAQSNYCPDTIFKFTDPEELRVVVNEMMFHYKNINSGYENCAYWLTWIFQWEKKNKKLKRSFEIDEREIPNVKKGYWKDVVWLIWSTILAEGSTRSDDVKYQVHALYQLFKYEFTGPKRNLRIPMIYHAIGYVTHSVSFTLSIISNQKLYIQSQCNVNLMFKMKKTSENNSSPKPLPVKEKRKKASIKDEQVADKLSLLHDIDILLR
jgi:hypothetical protein